MRGMGFLEAKTFTLTSRERLAAAGFDGELVEIINPKTTEYTVVRPNLLADMLDILALNKTRGLPQRFYEIGIAHDGKREKKMFAFAVMDRKVEFSDARGYLQTIASEGGFSFELGKKAAKIFDPEISCAIMMNGKENGVLGKVSKETMEGLGLEFEAYVCCFEV